MGYKPKKGWSAGAKWGLGICIVVILALLAVIFTPKFLSVDGDGDDGESSDGDTDTALTGPWADKLVDFQILTSDKYNGSNAAASAKVYDEKPTDWENPRGSFTDSALYTTYSASSGVITVNKEKPGHYYVLLTLSGYNSDFMEIDITDGTGRSGDLYDYNQEPDAKSVEMSRVGSTTDEDFSFTNTNQTDYTIRDTVTLTVADNTDLRGWKAIIDDTEGFSLDTDGDGTYDEGIKSYEVTICGQKKMIFKPANGIDLFDSNDEYTLEFESCQVDDLDDVSIKVEIVANTRDSAVANDELWGEGEGVLSYIKTYDKQGNLFSTTDVSA